MGWDHPRETPELAAFMHKMPTPCCSSRPWRKPRWFSLHFFTCWPGGGVFILNEHTTSQKGRSARGRSLFACSTTLSWPEAVSSPGKQGQVTAFRVLCEQ